MPIPVGNFDNTVIHVTATPIAASDLNTVIAARNTAGYWLTDLKFIDDDNAVLLFVQNDLVAIGYAAEQKINTVAISQAALDADKATEIALGYWPTGIFPSPAGTLFVLYQLIDPPSV